MTYFGVDSHAFSLEYYRKLQLATVGWQSVSFKANLEESQRLWLKRFLVLAIRHQALSGHIDSYGFAEAVFQADVSPLLELEDYRVLLSALRLLKTSK